MSRRAEDAITENHPGPQPRSAIPKRQRQVARGLGLRKTELLGRPADTPAIRGMIRKITHLRQSGGRGRHEPQQPPSRQRLPEGPTAASGAGPARAGRRPRAAATRASCPRRRLHAACAASRAARCPSTAASRSAASPTSSGRSTPTINLDRLARIAGPRSTPADMAAAGAHEAGLRPGQDPRPRRDRRGQDRPGPQVLRVGQEEDREGRRQGRPHRVVDHGSGQHPQHLQHPRPPEAGHLHPAPAGRSTGSAGRSRIPGISSAALAEFWQAQKGTILGFVDLFSGQYMSRMTIFALGIMPYISSSIILQLLTVVWPYLERLSKEGELGRKKITQYTRYGTIVICVIQAWGIALFLQKPDQPRRGADRPQPGHRLPAPDRPDPDHGDGLRHVAGRADLGAGHRQRHLADHLRRHRRPVPGRPERAWSPG